MFEPILSLSIEEKLEGIALYEVYKEYVFVRYGTNNLNTFTMPCSLDRVSTSNDFPNYMDSMFGTQKYMFIFGKSNKPEGSVFRSGHIVSHRMDGPAIIYSTGHLAWMYNGTHITSKMLPFYRENNISLTNPTEEQKFLIKMHMSNVVN